MKVTGSSKRKDVSKDGSAAEQKAESENMVLGQIKLEDLEQERLEVRKSVEKKTTATKKPAEKKSVSTTKAAAAEAKAEATAVEAAEAVEVKAEEKASGEVKTEAKKETKTAAKAEKETKTAAVKKEAKTAAKVEKETKTTTKTAKAAVSEKVVLQINGREDLVMSSLIDRVKAAYAAEGNKADNIKNIEVYIKLEPENMAYYVIDGYASGISLY